MSMPYVDAHCHITTRVPSRNECSKPILLKTDNTMVRCVMSTNLLDWYQLQQKEDTTIVKGFGVHPWYCHLFSMGHVAVEKRSHYESVLECKEQAELISIIRRLPEPIPLDQYIETYFKDHLIGVIGEIGLDKLFRLPENGFYAEAEKPARLTRVKVKMSHQVALFRRLCQLAVHFNKPVSIHDVKCHGKLFDICQEVFLPHEKVNICLHSFTGHPQTIEHQWLKVFPQERIFFSLSKYINFKSQVVGYKLLASLPKSCLLTETDFPIDGASAMELTEQLEYVCNEIKEFFQLTGLQESKELVYTNFKQYIKRID